MFTELAFREYKYDSGGRKERGIMCHHLLDFCFRLVQSFPSLILANFSIWKKKQQKQVFGQTSSPFLLADDLHTEVDSQLYCQQFLAAPPFS